MKTKHRRALIVLTTLITTALTAVYIRSDRHETAYEQTKILRYSFTLRNTSNRPLTDVEFATYAPVKHTSTQRCCQALTANNPYKLEIDPIGNQILRFRFDVIPPNGQHIVNISATVETTSIPHTEPPPTEGLFLSAEPFVERDATAITDLAAKLKSDTTATTSKRIYDWVETHLHYAGFIREDRGALYALKERKGDCTEYMYLTMALARANAIPARGLSGYVYANNAVLRSEDNHNWSEFYFNNAWQLIDSQKKTYTAQQADYIAMRILFPETRANAHRFWYTHPDLTVQMH